MNRLSAPGYDRFKLIVTIILLIILLFMLLRGCATVAPVSLKPEPDAVAPPGQLTEPPVESAGIQLTDTAEIAAASVMPSVTPTIVPATFTPASGATTPTPVPLEVTPDSSPTAPAAPIETPTTTTVEANSCNTSVPSRLTLGEKARVMQRLNMRNDPLITSSIIHTNATGTQVEIIGGPVCTPVGESAYLWWQIRLPNGAEGWSAESQLNERTYLLEPIE